MVIERRRSGPFPSPPVRALSLGACVLDDRSADADESLYVFADPAGHPFCIFVPPDHPG